MSNKRASTDSQSGNPSNIRLNDVNPIWLEASPTERYLLLEDTETGDILMPLIYMKHVLVANYSRKLAALKNRLVTIPVAGPLADQQGLLYWQWAFESPHAVKVIVRQEIGEATPQGHLRLVLIPIVYNALVAQDDLRSSPLFHALHRAMRSSTYWPLLLPLDDGLLPKLDAAAGITSPLPDPLFCGPRLLEATAIKYMFMFKDKEEMVASKRNRTTGASNIDNGVLTAAIMGSGLTQTTNLMALVPASGGVQRPGADAASMEAAAAAAMASAAAMAAAAAAAAAANADDDDDNDAGGGLEDYDDDDGGGMGGDSPPVGLGLALGNGNNNQMNINGGAPNLPSMQVSDINFHAQMVEAMMQQQLQLQQQQQQQQHPLPPLPPGLQPPPAMKQTAIQQHYPSQMQNNTVPHSNSFASLMRAATGNINNNNTMNTMNNSLGGGGGGGGAIVSHPTGLNTAGINIADVHTADAVRQLVDMKFQEVVRELMRLKSSMMQLYTAVVGVALTQGSVSPELLGVGSYLSSGQLTNGVNNVLSNNLFNRPGGGGGAQPPQAQNQAPALQPPPQPPQRMRANGGGGHPDLINQTPAWPPLYGEIQQAGGLAVPQQQGGPTARAPAVGGAGGSQPSQEELNLAALNKNNTNNTTEMFPSLSGLLNEYPKDAKYNLTSSLSLRDHPSLSLPDTLGDGTLPGSQQQMALGNGASPGAQHAAAWANAIGMSFPQQQGNNNNTGGRGQ